VTFEDAEIQGLAESQAPKLITEVPGPLAQAVVERDALTTSPSLPRAYRLAPKRAAGSVVEDVDGNLFLDLNAGIAVTSTGHCHPKVVEAIQRQAATLIHYSASDFYLPIYSELTEKLDEISPMKQRARAFLTNSGTEAVEAAMAFVDVIRGKELDRLRICAADDCQDVLVDLSKNRSRRFCGGSCANRTNVAAYRARKAHRERGSGVRGDQVVVGEDDGPGGKFGLVDLLELPYCGGGAVRLVRLLVGKLKKVDELRRVALLLGPGKKFLTVYAGDGAVVAEYGVRGLGNIVELDAGEVELP
jgi:hypothetical protein